MGKKIIWYFNVLQNKKLRVKIIMKNGFLKLLFDFCKTKICLKTYNVFKYIFKIIFILSILFLIILHISSIIFKNSHKKKLKITKNN